MKKVHGNLYFSVEALHEVPKDIRELYDRGLKLLGDSFKFNLVKIHKDKEAVTFSYYPHLETHTHPFLRESVKIELKSGSIQKRKESSHNPVILHRLETMLSSTNPRITHLQKETEDEEKLGMYKKEHINHIGRRKYWNSLCENNNIEKSCAPIDNNQANNTQYALFNDMEVKILRQRTAMFVQTPSIPTQIMHKEGLILNEVLDWGCGNGRDSRFLATMGYIVHSYDKFLKPSPHPSEISLNNVKTILCNYVINVIEDIEERLALIKDIFLQAKPGTKILISARSKEEIESAASQSGWQNFNDGYITSKRTFQKGFDLNELISLTQIYGTIVYEKKTKSFVMTIIQKN